MPSITGSAAAVNLLINRGAEVNAAESRRGQNALMWAISNHHADVVRALIEHRADFRASSKGNLPAPLVDLKGSMAVRTAWKLEVGKSRNYQFSPALAGNTVIAAGGDGYASLKKGKQIIDASAAPLMATVVMDYIQAKGTIAPAVEGRIIEQK